jgi:hypothetical protein
MYFFLKKKINKTIKPIKILPKKKPKVVKKAKRLGGVIKRAIKGTTKNNKK